MFPAVSFLLVIGNRIIIFIKYKNIGVYMYAMFKGYFPG